MAEKKAQQLPPLRTTLIDPDPHEPNAYVLELDELWSFVAKKANKVWVWLAICRRTRQIVGYALGDRDEATCRKLWRSIPARYRRGRCYTDFWEAYQAVIPVTKHRPVGKETGQTAHIERFNNTIRQRLARFVRKTLSFSKSEIMHEIWVLQELPQTPPACLIITSRTFSAVVGWLRTGRRVAGALDSLPIGLGGGVAAVRARCPRRIRADRLPKPLTDGLR